MKRNITINLFGSLYAIDEDAYELLKRYEENMRSYFHRKEGGEEISADIEYHVAELLAELKANGTEAITIEHVEEIIRRIGNPEQMDGGEAYRETPDGPQDDADEGGHRGAKYLLHRVSKWMRGRKLFRDTQDCMVGGVMSGLCHYFGGTDPLPWRIGMVLLCLFSFYAVAIVYLILWAFVPQARTAEERLWMKGRPVSPASINEELMHGMGKAPGAGQDKEKKAVAHGFAHSLVRFVLMCLKCALFMCGCIWLFVLLLAAILLVYCTFCGMESLLEYGIFNSKTVAVWQMMPGAGWMTWMLLVSLSVAIGIMLYALVRWMGKNETPLGSRTRVTLLLVWLAAAAAVFCATVFLTVQADRASDRYNMQRNTRGGNYLSRDSWDDLQERGWEVVSAKGLQPYICGVMQDPRTDEAVRIYDFEAQRHEWDGEETTTTPFQFHIRRSEFVQPGLYRLEALVNGHGRGGYVYAQLPSDTARYHLAYSLPKGQRLPQSLLRPDSTAYASGEEKHIRHWEELEHVVTDTIRVTNGLVTYGVTNDRRVTGVPCNGNDFSLVRINLVRIGDAPAATAVPGKQPADDKTL